VIKMPVGEQHRDRIEPVLAQHVAQWLLRILTGVDNHTRAARLGGEYEAVGLEGAGGETCDEHRDSTSGDGDGTPPA
jgi:hypothetical protein